jgi:hypothetical protein
MDGCFLTAWSKLESVNDFTDEMAKGRQLSQRQKMSTQCTTTVNASQHLSLSLETKYGSMELTSPPTNHYQNCLTID